MKRQPDLRVPDLAWCERCESITATELAPLSCGPTLHASSAGAENEQPRGGCPGARLKGPTLNTHTLPPKAPPRNPFCTAALAALAVKEG